MLPEQFSLVTLDEHLSKLLHKLKLGHLTILLSLLVYGKRHATNARHLA